MKNLGQGSMGDTFKYEKYRDIFINLKKYIFTNC